MNASMVHRGPDDEGVYTDPSQAVSLGARRLSIIDVERGHQPLPNESRTVWAVLNGEIYNHPRLQALLRRRGHDLATRTDTEVLVHLYEDYGKDMVHALEGMFAFAVWDEQRGALLLARDRFGEKPLFYQASSDRLVFASELTALIAGIGGLPSIDAGELDHLFVHGYLSPGGALLEGVHQLAPGHLLEWTGGGPLEERCYWKPPAATAGAPAPLEELTAETERLLDASVRSRLISDVPLGVFLSGGVDSTLIATMAAQSASRVKTFTVGYDVGSVSEVETARATASMIGSDHHELIMTEAEVAASVPDVLAALDQPVGDPALVALRAVAKFARSDVTVAVGGEGADELFGGYPRYRWLARAPATTAVPRPIARAAERVAAALPGKAGRAAHLVAPRPLLERHLDWVTGGRRHLRDTLYGPRLEGRGDVRALFPAPGAGLAQNGLVAKELMRLDQVHWLPGDVLAKADRASMQVSLEVRTPYLHHELAEFAASVPASVHLGGGGKRLLREVLARQLDGTLAKRPKTAFRVPAAEWLRGPLAPLLQRHVVEGPLCAEGWFDRAEVADVARQHIERRRDWSGVLWTLLATGLWLDRTRAAARG